MMYRLSNRFNEARDSLTQKSIFPRIGVVDYLGSRTNKPPYQIQQNREPLKKKNLSCSQWIYWRLFILFCPPIPSTFLLSPGPLGQFTSPSFAVITSQSINGRTWISETRDEHPLTGSHPILLFQTTREA